MPDRILVTGATGFIAKHVVRELLDAGFAVRGSARTADRAGEVRAAVGPALADRSALDRLEIVALDLTSDGGWTEAAQGCDVLVHTASPFPLAQRVPDPDTVIRPAVDGTLRALRAARDAGVGRVVLTSSTVAIVNGPAPPDGRPRDERDWSTSDHPNANAYVRSKTEAERAAWDFVRDEAPDMALTVVNPGFVLGPPLDGRVNTSLAVVARLMRGQDPMVPNFGFEVVDVRDVAKLHRLAVERPDTAGNRYVAAAGFLWFREMARILAEAYPDRRIPTRRAPDLMIRALALFDPALRGIVPILGRSDPVSAARAERDLGLAFRDPAQSVREAAACLVHHDRIDG